MVSTIAANLCRSEGSSRLAYWKWIRWTLAVAVHCYNDSTIYYCSGFGGCDVQIVVLVRGEVFRTLP